MSNDETLFSNNITDFKKSIIGEFKSSNDKTLDLIHTNLNILLEKMEDVLKPLLTIDFSYITLNKVVVDSIGNIGATCISFNTISQCINIQFDDQFEPIKDACFMRVFSCLSNHSNTFKIDHMNKHVRIYFGVRIYFNG